MFTLPCPLVGNSSSCVANSLTLLHSAKNSSGVVSLFTKVPVERATDVAQEKVLL